MLQDNQEIYSSEEAESSSVFSDRKNLNQFYLISLPILTIPFLAQVFDLISVETSILMILGMVLPMAKLVPGMDEFISRGKYRFSTLRLVVRFQEFLAAPFSRRLEFLGGVLFSSLIAGILSLFQESLTPFFIVLGTFFFYFSVALLRAAKLFKVSEKS